MSMRKFITAAATALGVLGAAGLAQAQGFNHGGAHGSFNSGGHGSFNSGGRGGFASGGYRGGGYRGGGYRGGGYRGGEFAAGAIGFGLGAALASPYYYGGYYDDYDYGPDYYDQPAYGCGGWQWSPWRHRYIWVNGCY
jgi:hypothetical protein